MLYLLLLSGTALRLQMGYIDWSTHESSEYEPNITVRSKAEKSECPLSIYIVRGYYLLQVVHDSHEGIWNHVAGDS